MYGYPNSQSGGAMKALCIFVGLLLVGAIVAGVMLGGSELFSPSLNAAKADKLKAETAALRAQTTYEQRQREMELRLAEQKAAAELRALQDRRAMESELLEIAGIVGPIVGSAVMITLAAAVIVLSIGAAVGLALLLANRGRKPPHAEAWTSERRALAIREAKLREREERLEQMYLQQRLSQLTQVYTGNDGDGRNGETPGQMPSTITPWSAKD